MDPAIVALAGGQQLQGQSGFRSVLLPGFTGHFFYPGQRKTHSELTERRTVSGIRRWIRTCPRSYWRAAGGFQRSVCGTPAEPGPAPRAGSPARSAARTHAHRHTRTCSHTVLWGSHAASQSDRPDLMFCPSGVLEKQLLMTTDQ